jgi:hypothetical protein
MGDLRTYGLTTLALIISMQNVTPVLQILSLLAATIYSCVGIYKRLKK